MMIAILDLSLKDVSIDPMTRTRIHSHQIALVIIGKTVQDISDTDLWTSRVGGERIRRQACLFPIGRRFAIRALPLVQNTVHSGIVSILQRLSM